MSAPTPETPYKVGAVQSRWETTWIRAQCTACPWSHHGPARATLTEAVYGHVKSTGHAVLSSRTQSRVSRPDLADPRKEPA